MLQWHRQFPVRKTQGPEIGCEEVAATTLNQVGAWASNPDIKDLRAIINAASKRPTLLSAAHIWSGLFVYSLFL